MAKRKHVDWDVQVRKLQQQMLLIHKRLTPHLPWMNALSLIFLLAAIGFSVYILWMVSDWTRGPTLFHGLTYLTMTALCAACVYGMFLILKRLPSLGSLLQKEYLRVSELLSSSNIGGLICEYEQLMDVYPRNSWLGANKKSLLSQYAKTLPDHLNFFACYIDAVKLTVIEHKKPARTVLKNGSQRLHSLQSIKGWWKWVFFLAIPIMFGIIGGHFMFYGSLIGISLMLPIELVTFSLSVPILLRAAGATLAVCDFLLGEKTSFADSKSEQSGG